jgi:hypothetical protein
MATSADSRHLQRGRRSISDTSTLTDINGNLYATATAGLNLGLGLSVAPTLPGHAPVEDDPKLYESIALLSRLTQPPAQPQPQAQAQPQAGQQLLQYATVPQVQMQAPIQQYQQQYQMDQQQLQQQQQQLQLQQAAHQYQLQQLHMHAQQLQQQHQALLLRAAAGFPPWVPPPAAATTGVEGDNYEAGAFDPYAAVTTNPALTPAPYAPGQVPLYAVTTPQQQQPQPQPQTQPQQATLSQPQHLQQQQQQPQLPPTQPLMYGMEQEQSVVATLTNGMAGMRVSAAPMPSFPPVYASQPQQMMQQPPQPQYMYPQQPQQAVYAYPQTQTTEGSGVNSSAPQPLSQSVPTPAMLSQ